MGDGASAFSYGGAMGQAIGAFDWANHPLGPVAAWPVELRTVVDLCLRSHLPFTIYWGSEYRMIYNDAAIPALGDRPLALGKRGDEAWGEWWSAIAEQFREVETTGQGVLLTDARFEEPAGNRVREKYWNLSFTPLTDADGQLRGILAGARDTTREVAKRRVATLRDELDKLLLPSASTEAMASSALALLGRHLDAQRTGLAEIDGDGTAITITQCWTDGTLPGIGGTYPLGSFGRISEDLRSGVSVRIDDNRLDPRTDDEATLAAYARIDLRSGIATPIHDLGRYAGGVFVHASVPRKWSDAEVALVEAAAGKLWTALVRSRAETALRESEERYRLIFEQIDDIIFTTDLDQVVTDCNAAGAAAIGLPRDEIVGRPCADFVSPAQFAIMVEKLQHKLKHGGTTRHEVELTGKGGRALRWEVASSLQIDRDGRVTGLHVVARDVTERRAFDERRELLIHELNHRVKNTLSLVQALAQQSLRGAPDLATGEAQFLDRLRALAHAHDLLTRDQWEGVTLAELVDGATGAAGAGARLQSSGPDVILPPKAAVSMTMALHELTTNSVKYGALSTTDGAIYVDWRRDDDGFTLSWRERGGPRVAPPARRGFGIRMIERVLASDLGGQVEMSFLPEGLECMVKAPLAAVGADR